MRFNEIALRLARELYDGGMDINDIWLVGNNMQAQASDDFWIKMIKKEEVTTNDIESELATGD